MSTLPIIALFLLNMVAAFSIKMAVNDKTRKEYLSYKWVKWILLVPPVSLILATVILVFGILYTIYTALSLYLSND